MLSVGLKVINLRRLGLGLGSTLGGSFSHFGGFTLPGLGRLNKRVRDLYRGSAVFWREERDLYRGSVVFWREEGREGGMCMSMRCSIFVHMVGNGY